MPIDNGKITCKINLNITVLSSIDSPGAECKYRLMINGVINTPAKLDSAELKIADAIFPPDIDTITTDDDTVEGKLAKNIIPVFKIGSNSLGNANVIIKANNGKKINVDPCIKACSR